MADDLTTKVLTDYPMLAFLLHDPEVGPLLLAAVDPNAGFDAATFQMKLMQTNWWRTASASQRQWETLIATDPATATNQKEAWKAQAQQVAHRYGVDLSGDRLENWAGTMLSQGIQTTDPRFISALVSLHDQGFTTGDSGIYEDTTNQLRQVASAYMIDLTPADYTWWSDQIARGDNTVQGFTDEAKQLAMTRYSAYADRINAGATPDQIFGQYRNAIANELDVPAQSIDLMHDARWSKVTGVPTENGQARPMTYSEAITLARAQPEWQRTASARQQGADLTDTILKTFGKIG